MYRQLFVSHEQSIQHIYRKRETKKRNMGRVIENGWVRLISRSPRLSSNAIKSPEQQAIDITLTCKDHMVVTDPSTF